MKYAIKILKEAIKKETEIKKKAVIKDNYKDAGVSHQNIVELEKAVKQLDPPSSKKSVMKSKLD